MPHPFRFGVTTANARSHTDWTTQARKIEDLGYSTLLIPDRMSAGLFSPFTALAVAAEATKTLRIGSYVFCNDYRHPVVLAREAASLDLLSDGRFELGLGAGVSGQEFQEMGIPFASAGTRVGRLEESIQLIKQLFTEETVNFNGKHYAVNDLKGQIPPVQKPHLPILIAGAGERMLKLAAREANSIAIGSKVGRGGVDPSDPPLEQKLAWIKTAAGERFSALELGQSIYTIEISDSKAAPTSAIGWGFANKQVLSTEQAVEHLLDSRDRYGFSYLQIYEGQVENFAPVVARLAGK
jgi:probable F420-dependent oxidoreductase